MPRPPVRLLHPGDDAGRPRAARPQPAPDRGGDPRRRSPATSAAAPATRTSSPRSSGTADNPATQDDQRGDRMTAVEDAPLSAAGNPIGSPACTARRTCGSCAARATTSTTCSCRGCCTARSLRSPYAHAKILPIDTSRGARRREAWARSSPARTLEDLSARVRCRRCRRQPRPSRHRQGALSQGQEVAFVWPRAATSRGRARAHRQVDYDAAARRRRREEGARRRRADHPRRQGGQDRQPHLRLGGGQHRPRPRPRSPPPRSW